MKAELSQQLDKNIRGTIMEGMFNYQEALIKTGLSETQAGVYEILLRFGGQTARLIQARSPFKRGLVYKALEQLEELNLVEKREDKGKIAVFFPKHPYKIKELAENKHREAELSLLAVDGVLSQLSSDFNLVSGQPGVKFFEGLEGFKKVSWDSLTSKTPIYTYGDLEMIAKKFGDINKRYLSERKRRGIKKLAITNDSPFNRQFIGNYDQDLTKTRLANGSDLDFSSTITQIYDNKISYTTINGDSIIAMIIDNPQLYKMSRSLFEYHWRQLDSKPPKSLSPSPAPEKQNISPSWDHDQGKSEQIDQN